MVVAPTPAPRMREAGSASAANRSDLGRSRWHPACNLVQQPFTTKEHTMRYAIPCAFVLALAVADAEAQSGKSPFYGKTTNQVLGELSRAGNSFGAAHRDERSLMNHQFYGQRDDYGYRTTGQRIVQQQQGARSQVSAAVAELQRRMTNIADPRERGRISQQISKVEQQMSRQESHTRATTPYLNMGGAGYRPSWR